MSPLHKLFSDIIGCSNALLETITGSELPDVEVLKAGFNERDEFIQQLGHLVKEHPPESFSDQERKSLRNLFRQFKNLNKQINHHLQNVLGQQKERVAVATRQRNAEKQYKISKQPDISYY